MYIHIINGHVIDPYRNLNGIGEVWIKDHRVISAEEAKEAPKGKVMEIDAEGHYVLPGLIDFHAHGFYSGSPLGINPELVLANGVTTMVDAGTAGAGAFEAFYDTVLSRTMLTMRSLLNVSTIGIVGSGIDEDLSPELFLTDKIKYLCEKYKGLIIGLKMRMSEGCLKNSGISSLQTAKKLAEEVGLPLFVHSTGSAMDVDILANELRAGDVYCHIFQGSKYNAMKNERMSDAIMKARERGVLFDDAHGLINYSIEIARKAVSQGFLPDFISTDHTTLTLYKDGFAKSLTHIISEYMEFGMNLYDILKIVLVNSSKFLGMEGQIGTLRPGAFADVAILKPIEGKPYYSDLTSGFTGSRILCNMMTIKNGMIVYRSDAF